MSAPKRPSRVRGATRRSQRGAALIIMVLIMVLGVSWLLVSALSTWLNPAAANPTLNGKALSQAKAALLGYVATDVMTDKNPGSLPCPEPGAYVGTSNEGIAAGNCTLPAVGRLPWRTLGLDKLLDASGQPLWYVVSPGWALPFSTAVLNINYSTPGQLTVDGQANAAVALIIAPGPPLTVQASANCTARVQTRSTTPPDYRDYLECQNASGGSSFATSGPAGSFNDQVLEVTAADVMRVIGGPIAQRMQRDIVPLIASAAQVMPGGSAGKPLFPLAAAWGNPTTSTYTGTANTFNGLLPLTRSRKACAITDPACDPTLLSEPCLNSDAQCDCVGTTNAQCNTPGTTYHPTAVSWPIGSSVSTKNTAGNTWTVTWKNGPNVVQVFTINQAPDDTTALRINKVNCNASSSTQISCAFTYGWNCPGWMQAATPPLCSISPLVTLNATADNVGLAFRTVNPAELGGMYYPGGSGNMIALAADGSASLTTEWQLPATPSNCNNDKCQTATVNVPSLYITDNVGFQSQLRDVQATNWFLDNNWQQWTYYAVSAGYAPGGPIPTACGGGNPPCLTVNNYTPLPNNNKEALLVFSGRALPGRTQPSSQLTDYFEGQNATPADSIYEKRSAITSSFNDRVLVIAP